MTRIIKEYLFINYCGQILGQFKGSDIRKSLLNVIVAQVVPIFSIAITFIYVALGFHNPWIFIILILIIAFLTRMGLKRYFFHLVPILELNEMFNKRSKAIRLFNFFIAIILTGGSVVIFALSLYLLKYIS